MARRKSDQEDYGVSYLGSAFNVEQQRQSQRQHQASSYTPGVATCSRRQIHGTHVTLSIDSVIVEEPLQIRLLYVDQLGKERDRVYLVTMRTPGDDYNLVTGLLLAEGVIEIAPIGFMRGRTLNNAFIVIDEAQNCTYTQLKMLLTRLGWHSTMVITGDPAQSDLLPEFSGLATAAERLEKLGGASVIRLEGKDVVRHPLVQEMLDVL